MFEILSDLVKIENILLIVRNDSATSEIKTNFQEINQKEKWITIGTNEDPAHLHINSEMINSIRFVEEKKPDRTSFSVRFFDKDEERVFAAFFTKMYDDQKNLDPNRKKTYDNLRKKFDNNFQK